MILWHKLYGFVDARPFFKLRVRYLWDEKVSSLPFKSHCHAVSVVLSLLAILLGSVLVSRHFLSFFFF